MVVLIKLKGQNGQLELYEDRVILKRKGFLSKVMVGSFTKGEKTIFLNQITGIDYKKAGALQGYIQFTIGGSNEGTGGWSQSHKDENTITFNHKKNTLIAEEIIAKINELQKSANIAQVVNNISGADELIKFKQLLDEGIITEEQFEKKKEEILG